MEPTNEANEKKTPEENPERDIIVELIRGRLRKAADNPKINLRGLKELSGFLRAAQRMLLRCTGPMAAADAQLMGGGIPGMGIDAGDDMADYEPMGPAIAAYPMPNAPETFGAVILKELAGSMGNFQMLFRANTAASIVRAQDIARKAGDEKAVEKLGVMFDKLSGGSDGNKDSGDQGSVPPALPAVPAP